MPKAWYQCVGNDVTNPNMFFLTACFCIFSTYCPWKMALAPFVLIDTAWLVPNLRRNDLRIRQTRFGIRKRKRNGGYSSLVIILQKRYHKRLFGKKLTKMTKMIKHDKKSGNTTKLTKFSHQYSSWITIR